MSKSCGKNTGVFQPQTLDVDESIFDKNLKIVDKDLEGSISEIFPGLDNASKPYSTQNYKNERKELFPQQEYPTIQVLAII